MPLDEDPAGLAGFLDGADMPAAARDKLRTCQLRTCQLGPEFPDGLSRFSAAVERVCAG
ncbi:hypothetical protein AB0H88_24215 [Nonomuraea sp. NPDC050680]|uniref:hypothetical protein n=1 Tax=Nonomuraea sp. NPDC050680 TaxID=3154630 RepID=UPI003408F640